MRRNRIVNAAYALSITFGVATSAGQPSVDDPLDRQLKKLAPQGIDCGRVDLEGAQRAEVNACVKEHFVASRSFRARYECLSDDSTCWWGIALSPSSGGVAVVLYDSMGCPGQPPSSYCGTDIQYCDYAKLVPVGDRLKIRCTREFEL